MKRLWLKLRLWWIETRADALAEARHDMTEDYRESFCELSRQINVAQTNAIRLRAQLRNE